MMRKSISRARSSALRAFALGLALALLLRPADSALAEEPSSHALHSVDGEVVTLELSPSENVYHTTVAMRNDGEAPSGHLIVSAHGNVLPAADSLAMSPDMPLADDADIVVLAALVTAVGLVVGRWRWKTHKKFNLGDEMGTASWDFSTAWASTLTAVGALLGTLLSAGVLPEETQRLSKAEYAGVNLFFGVLIVIAPLAFNAARKVSGGSGTKEYVGSVGWFLIASGVTLWAVLGELATIFLLLGEIRTAESATTFVILVLAGLFFAAIALVLKYAWTSIYFTVETQSGPKDPVALERDLEELKNQLAESQRGVALASAAEIGRIEAEIEEKTRRLEAKPAGAWSIM